MMKSFATHHPIHYILSPFLYSLPQPPQSPPVPTLLPTLPILLIAFVMIVLLGALRIFLIMIALLVILLLGELLVAERFLGRLVRFRSLSVDVEVVGLVVGGFVRVGVVVVGGLLNIVVGGRLEVGVGMM